MAPYEMPLYKPYNWSLNITSLSTNRKNFIKIEIKSQLFLE
jgi:hypothetical protein